MSNEYGGPAKGIGNTAAGSRFVLEITYGLSKLKYDKYLQLIRNVITTTTSNKKVYII